MPSTADALKFSQPLNSLINPAVKKNDETKAATT